jgi:hypothetical protein
MHPTLNAMVAAEREVDIARAVERRSYVALASLPHQPVTAPQVIGAAQVLVAAKTALAELVSRLVASRHRGTAGREVCCT